MKNTIMKDVMTIQGIDAVPTILEAVAALTGLRFVCIARVTDNSWTACAVLDNLNFGLKPGDDLDISTTLCEEVRKNQQSIIINSVSESEKYCAHPTPQMYGFESYVSIPIIRPNGEYFGTLCGLDPLPADLLRQGVIASMTMFAELIAAQLANATALAASNEALENERETAELREQFIAVLGHDMRNPLNAILIAAQLLEAMPDVDEKVSSLAKLIHSSAFRMGSLVNDVVDFTRGRMGGGITAQRQHEKYIGEMLQQIISELAIEYPERKIFSTIDNNITLFCDRGRIGQLLSNLVKNALIHGDAEHPVQVSVTDKNGIFQLSVTNAGPTLRPETIPQLFKPFWRAKTSTGKEGLGLGLFIVSEIASSHGGKIDVVSADDMTSFIFTLKSETFIERRSKPVIINFAERREKV